MRVLEIISGLGEGGAELALASRLEHAPSSLVTGVVSTTPEISPIAERIANSAEICRETSVMKLSSVIQHARRFRPDLIVTHNPREALRVLLSHQLRTLAPVVVVAHNEITSEYRYKALVLDALLPRVNRLAKRHIAVSARAARGPQCRGGRDVRVVLLGAEVHESIPRVSAWPAATQLRLLSLSRLSPQKNIESLLRAVAISAPKLRLRKAHLVVAGDGPDRAKLSALLPELAITDLVSMVGWTSPSDSLMSAADLFVIPSRREGGPLTLYEALLHGTRVAATPCGSAPELLGLFEGEILGQGSDAASISTMLERATQIGEFSSEERQHRRQRYSQLSISNSSKCFYDQLLSP